MDVAGSSESHSAPLGPLTAGPNTTPSAAVEADPLARARQTREAEAQALRAEQSEIRQLAKRDREVRAHELAHAAVGGPYASNPVYQYTQGPNGVRYATSGHVKVDVSPIPGDPAATLEKMQTVARAALAPAQPSAADRAIAAQANQQATQARAELAALQAESRAQALEEGAQRSGEGRGDHLSTGARRPPVGSVSGGVIDLLV